MLERFCRDRVPKGLVRLGRVNAGQRILCCALLASSRVIVSPSWTRRRGREGAAWRLPARRAKRGSMHACRYHITRDGWHIIAYAESTLLTVLAIALVVALGLLAAVLLWRRNSSEGIERVLREQFFQSRAESQSASPSCAARSLQLLLT
jgi:hypothetical protein